MLTSPLTNLGCIVGSTKDQFRCAVVSGANVRHVWFVFHQNLGTAEITELQDAGARVEEKVLGLDVAMADALRVNVCKSPEKLVDVQLHLKDGHSSLHFVEETGGAVHGFWHELLDQVEVNLILLLGCKQSVFQ